MIVEERMGSVLRDEGDEGVLISSSMMIEEEMGSVLRDGGDEGEFECSGTPGQVLGPGRRDLCFKSTHTNLAVCISHESQVHTRMRV